MNPFVTFHATVAATKSSSSSVTFLLFIVLIIGALYLLFLRPQQQRARKQREMMSAIDVGDEVLTVGGIVGRVLFIDGDRVTIETGDGGGQYEAPGTRLVLLRSAISRKLEVPTTSEAAGDGATPDGATPDGPTPDAVSPDGAPPAAGSSGSSSGSSAAGDDQITGEAGPETKPRRSEG